MESIVSSFRDPNGFVFNHNGKFYRAIRQNYQKEYNHLMGSGLYTELISEHLLIPYEEVEPPVQSDFSFYKVLFPEQIEFFSYPYEWCFEQWKDVLLAFLKVNKIALKYGMILQDATCFNFTFHKGRAIFFDTVSFVFYKKGHPWMAYRQFCESMLGPFTLMKYNGNLWSRSFAMFINGIELSFISKQLHWRTYLNPVVFLHIHLHAKYLSKKPKETVSSSGMDSKKIRVLWNLLEGTIKQWNLNREKKKEWSYYYDQNILSLQYLERKEKIIDTWLARLQPEVLTDLGANSGRFSFIGSKYASQVIAIEPDAGCVNNFYANIKESGYKNITLIQADIMQPTPAIGWNNTEREPLISRVGADITMALALVHHLCIVNNLPLDFLASFINSITTKYAIVEFVPKSDPMVVSMLKSRADIFEGYTESNFVISFEQYFTLVEIENIAFTNRTIYLWKKK